MIKDFIQAVQKLFAAPKLQPKSEQAGLETWQQTSHWINDLMWGNDVDYWDNKERTSSFRLKETIADAITIQSLMKPVEEERIVYRGTSSEHFPGLLENTTEGIIIPFLGFASTSDSYGVARSFSGNSENKEAKKIVFRVKLEKGRSAYKISNAEFGAEQETIIPPALYEVTGSTIDESGVYVIDIEQRTLLDVKDILLNGLDHMQSNLKTRNISPKTIKTLKRQIEEYYQPAGEREIDAQNNAEIQDSDEMQM